MAIRSSVTVSLVPQARGGPFVFWDDLAEACRAAKSLGFDAIEIFPTGPEDLSAERVSKLLDAHGLQLAAMGTGAGWLIHKLTLTQADASARARAVEFVRGIVDLAGTLGAPAIIGSMQGRWGDDVDATSALGYLTDALHTLALHAHTFGQMLLYEPLNRYETNLANTVSAGVEIVTGLGKGNVRLLADLFHMNIEEVDIAQALRHGGAHIGHVHFVDSNRRAAGMGHLSYAPIAEALRAIEYNGYASAEALPLPDPETAARQTMTAFRAVFGTP